MTDVDISYICTNEKRFRGKKKFGIWNLETNQTDFFGTKFVFSCLNILYYDDFIRSVVPDYADKIL